jgi:Gram-negative porin
VKSLRSWKRSTQILCSLSLASLLFTQSAAAEKTLVKTPEFEVYTDGRVGAFLGYHRGDALPRSGAGTTGNHDILGGGQDGVAVRDPIPGTTDMTQGTIEGFRVRSGFIGNTLGIGVRSPIDENTTVTAYIQMWAFVEAIQHRKTVPVPPDMRQGYVKVQGPWGSVLAGKSRALFSRGATDINVMYGHRWGVGFVGGGSGGVDNYGPTQGHIGFGVLGSGFAPGIVYATPVLSGLQLTVGAFDPIQLQGAWTRTKWLRPEGEVTFEHPIGDMGKFVLFTNGAWQKLYREDLDPANCPDGIVCEETAAGFGYGGRIEIGPFHLGAAGHYGKGLGLNYALEPSDATLDPNGNLRKFDGYYVQSQLALGQVDISAGFGITRVFLNPQDSVASCNGNPCMPGEVGDIPHSIIKSQTGFSAGVVYHVTPSLHLDLDAFRAQFRWFLGEKQNVNYVHTGMTFNW